MRLDRSTRKQRRRQRASDERADLGDRHGKPEGRQGCHRVFRDPARHDRIEERQVDIDVERDAMHGATGTVDHFSADADGCQLCRPPRIDPDPDARMPVESADAARNVSVEERNNSGDDSVFEESDMGTCRPRVVIDGDDWIRDNLPGAMKRDIATPIGLDKRGIDTGWIHQHMGRLRPATHGDRSRVLDEDEVILS